MKKRFYGKISACLLSMTILATNAAPTGAQEDNPAIQTSYYAKEAASSDTAGIDATKMELGDMNADGEVNLLDVQAALQGILKLNTLSEAQIQAADINKDGKVTIQDVHYMLKGALNVIPDLKAVNHVQQLIAYMNTYGEKFDDGTRFIISEDYGTQNTIYYDPNDNILEFVQMKIVDDGYKTEYLSAFFTYDISTLNAVDHKINFAVNCSEDTYGYNIVSEAEFDCRTYQRGDLPFVVTKAQDSPYSDTELYKYANKTAVSAISDWNMLLYLKSGFQLSDIGFYSF